MPELKEDSEFCTMIGTVNLKKPGRRYVTSLQWMSIAICYIRIKTLHIKTKCQN